MVRSSVGTTSRASTRFAVFPSIYPGFVSNDQNAWKAFSRVGDCGGRFSLFSGGRRPRAGGGATGGSYSNSGNCGSYPNSGDCGGSDPDSDSSGGNSNSGDCGGSGWFGDSDRSGYNPGLAHLDNCDASGCSRSGQCKAQRDQSALDGVCPSHHFSFCARGFRRQFSDNAGGAQLMVYQSSGFALI